MPLASAVSTVAAAGLPLFEDVTAAAGLASLTPGLPAVAPNCLFDELEGGSGLAQGALTTEGQRSDLFLHVNGTATETMFEGDDERRLTLEHLGKHSERSILVDHGVLCQIERNVGGAAVDDYDGDGHVDMVISGQRAPILLRNRGDGIGFEDMTDQAGIRAAWETTASTGRSNGLAFFDCDNDGDSDLFVSTLAARQNLLFINSNGRGSFIEEAALRGLATLGDSGHAAVRTAGTGVAVGDYDGDGLCAIHSPLPSLALDSDTPSMCIAPDA